VNNQINHTLSDNNNYQKVPTPAASVLLIRDENGKIEVAPLAYMRGRTLNDSFLILDEAQNCTPAQMKMFLTRIGFGSTAVVTGDITQTDLPKGTPSGLADAIKILDSQKDIAFHYFHPDDVVRHNLVQKIIEAYERKNN